jgi:hypothetical protein
MTFYNLLVLGAIRCSAARWMAEAPQKPDQITKRRASQYSPQSAASNSLATIQSNHISYTRSMDWGEVSVVFAQCIYGS